MATSIVGLTGKKGSGKDTFADFLVRNHGFTRIAFADALKDLALDLDPILAFDQEHQLQARLSEYLDRWGWDGAKQHRPVRELLQTLGVAVRNNVSERAWVDVVAHKAAYVAGPVVVTDVRFVNEANFIKYAQGTLIRIDRPGLDTRDQHVSETDLDSRIDLIDGLVSNHRGIDALADTAARLVEHLSTVRFNMLSAARV